MADIEQRTRPVDPEVRAALDARWQELPDHVRTPAQMLGRNFTGCEATHGVFPACDFGCRPCYPAANANRVPVDGAHTVTAVTEQMSYLRARRGPGQYAQLIGGEVSLLAPEAHAAALEACTTRGDASCRACLRPAQRARCRGEQRTHPAAAPPDPGGDP